MIFKFRVCIFFYWVNVSCERRSFFFFLKNHLLIGNRRGKGEKEGGFSKISTMGIHFCCLVNWDEGKL